MFEIIDDLKEKLDQQRPLSALTVKNLHEDLILRWTYHSNAIEGNTLNLLETKVVLEGIAVGGITLIEHFEAINHRDAILYIVLLANNIILSSTGSDSLRVELVETQIRNIHQLILKNIDDENAGRYVSRMS